MIFISLFLNLKVTCFTTFATLVSSACTEVDSFFFCQSSLLFHYFRVTLFSFRQQAICDSSFHNAFKLFFIQGSLLVPKQEFSPILAFQKTPLWCFITFLNISLHLWVFESFSFFGLVEKFVSSTIASCFCFAPILASLRSKWLLTLWVCFFKNWKAMN